MLLCPPQKSIQYLIASAGNPEKIMGACSPKEQHYPVVHNKIVWAK